MEGKRVSWKESPGRTLRKWYLSWNRKGEKQRAGQSGKTVSGGRRGAGAWFAVRRPERKTRDVSLGAGSRGDTQSRAHQEAEEEGADSRWAS